MRSIILIVDDHPLVGEAFELAIQGGYAHYDVGRVTSAAEAEAYARKHADRIKLVLLDLMLPDTTGFTAVLRMQQLLPDRPIAIVSARADAHSVAMARSFGVAGYLSKTMAFADMLIAIGPLLRGEKIFPADAPTASPASMDFHRKLAALSAAQLRVLTAVADGRLNKQIANDMGLTEGTVKQHMSAIFRKLGVNNRSQAILAVQPFLKS